MSEGAKVLSFAGLRAAAAALVARAQFASRAGLTFGGRRDLYKALGYKRNISSEDYRERFKRNAVAARIVEAMPQSTWRGGGELVENEDISSLTTFEQAWDDLNLKHHIWSTFLRADKIAGLGHYSIIAIVAPGAPESPLTRMPAEDLWYFEPFSEEDAPIEKYEDSTQSPRYGLPVTYTLKRATNQNEGSKKTTIGARSLHYTRAIHVADGLLDDRVLGIPRLERVWNLLDDLEKVTGGGSEAFWKRADQGLQLDLDPEIELDSEAEKELDDEIEEYTHGLKRVMKTRGITPTPLGSDVAGFRDPVDSIISQISAGTGIPQRILMGSERGHLASSQDKDNWTERVTDRRNEFAGPHVVRQLVDRLVELGTLPKPKRYDVRWPEIQNLDENQKADVARKWAGLNRDAGMVVVTADEIRDRILGMPPLGFVPGSDAGRKTKKGLPGQRRAPGPSNTPPPANPEPRPPAAHPQK